MAAPPQPIVSDGPHEGKPGGLYGFLHAVIDAGIEIVDYDTGARVPFTLRPSQATALDYLTNGPVRRDRDGDKRIGWTYLVKSRREGFSTITDLYDAAWTGLHDAAGDKVRTALIWANETEALPHLEQISDFCTQMQMPHQKKSETIVFPNGSDIVIRSPRSGTALGRGSGINRYHLSEFPFWVRAAVAWRAINGAIQGDEAECTIETTMALVDPTASKVWSSDNDFAKVFCGVEGVPHYRIAEGSRDFKLTDDDEARLRAEGFTIREAMAWWLWKCRNGYEGDWTACFCDFPQLPHHPFASSSGKWFAIVPRILTPVMTMPVTGRSGILWLVEWFIHPSETSGHVVVAVDTGRGVGADHSVVVIVDKITRRVVACFAHNQIQRDDLARVAVAMFDEVNDVVRRRGAPPPVMYVETNGPGKYTYNEIISLGGAPSRIHTKNDDDAGETLLATKRAAEAGHCYGPSRFHDEALLLTRKIGDDGNTVRGWVGPKDVSMALGWCYRDIQRNPVAEPPKVKTPSEVYAGELARYKREVRRGRR